MTKIGREVEHVTCDSDTNFKVKRSKVKVTDGGGHTVAASRTACYILKILKQIANVEYVSACRLSMTSLHFRKRLCIGLRIKGLGLGSIDERFVLDLGINLGHLDLVHIPEPKPQTL